MSATPAMTLIDVDGYLAPEELAVLGASAAADAIRRLDIGGSIGIDLPTAGSKAARQDAAEQIDTRLPQPFERTAVNGFGFVQIVRPRTRPSLVELAQDRPAFEARALLRRAVRKGQARSGSSLTRRSLPFSTATPVDRCSRAAGRRQGRVACGRSSPHVRWVCESL